MTPLLWHDFAPFATPEPKKGNLSIAKRKTPDFVRNRVFFWCAVQDSNL